MKTPVILAACSIAVVTGQPRSQPPTFRVAIDVVSIDAVVTDRKGEVVRDLTAADFEVLQDGKRQKVTSAQFVRVGSAAAFVKAAGPADGLVGAAAPPLPAAPPSREEVTRSFVLLVDDLGLSVAGLNNVRQALRGFVDTALLPTDLVAIVRTGEARSLTRALTNDREALHAAIDALRFNPLSRYGVSALPDIIQLGGGQPEFEEPVNPVQRWTSNMASLAALNLVVQAARDLPGRKVVVVASEGVDLKVNTDVKALDDGTRARGAAARVIDQAARSGVVIYALHSAGLQSGGIRASDDIHQTAAETPGPGGANMTRDGMGRMVRSLETDRTGQIRDSQDGLAYLAGETGGVAIMNTNDLAAGLGRISNDVRDYYVIGYEPEPSTFALKDKLPPLHTITVNVRRAGVRVRARKEFIGVPDPERPAGPLTPAQQLVRAAMSPFSVAAIGLRATNLPGYAPGRGLFIRAVLHLDAQALAFSTDAAGTRSAAADVVGLVFNGDGAQIDTIGTGFTVTLEDAAAKQAMTEGLVYTTLVPIPKPGGYQLRYALRDRRSGALGSAGGFVSVPDVVGGAFALSGLVLRAGDRRVEGVSLDSDRFTVTPADALRSFAPGTQLSYSCEIYNAESPVQAVASLWRDTDRVTTLPVITLVPRSRNPLALDGALKLADDLPRGQYVLEVAVRSEDPKHSKKGRGGVQRISFDVR